MSSDGQRSSGRPSMMRSLNHVSRVCKDIQTTAAFYRDLLGFIDIRRPGFDFEGAWLYSPHCAIGVHLIKGNPVERAPCINPQSDHLSFVVSSLAEFEELLVKRNMEFFKQAIIEEDGIQVTQIFFHDPENNMIEICNCDEFPVQPLPGIDAAVGCAACQPHPAWANLPLANKALTEDAMSCKSSHSASSHELENTLFDAETCSTTPQPSTA